MINKLFCLLLALSPLAVQAQQLSSDPAVDPTMPLVRQQVVSAAETEIGVPYRAGGTAPESGFDCSGLVRYVFAKSGIDLPHGTSQLLKQGEHIRYEDAKVGDLMVFKFSNRKHPSMHVGIYLGNGWMIHAPSRGGRVMKSRVDQFPWPNRYLTTLRMLP